MPPQRRKIVPPNTTSKARKKVAGSGRSARPESSTTSAAEHEDAAIASDAATGTPEPATPEPGASESATPEPAASESATPEPVTRTSDFESVPSLEKKAPVAASPSFTETAAAARTNWVPAIVVGVIALALIAFAVVAAIKPGTSVDNAAWIDQGDSSEVTRAATDGLTALYRYNYETIDDDLAKARDFMGPELQEQTNQFLDAIKSSAQQTQTGTDVDVMDIGLTRLESDKAELLANMNVSSTRAGVAYDNVMFPIVVNMEKIDDRWVVSATELK